jgi:vancomycin resistance protein YoaR
MPEHPPLSDETVRMDVADDTRPVGRGVLPAPAGSASDGPSPDDATAPHLPVDVPPPPAAGPDEPGGPHDDGSGSRRPPWWRRRAVLVPAAAVAVLGGAYGADLALAGGAVPRSTVVNGVHLGGLSPAAAARALQHDLAPRIAARRTVQAADVRLPLLPAEAGLALDVDGTVAAARRQPLNPWTRLATLFADRRVPPVLSRDPAKLSAAVAGLAEQVDHAPVDATITLRGTTPTVVQPADGRRVDRDGAASAITAALLTDRTSVRAPVVVTHPHVSAAEARKVLARTVGPALSAPVTVTAPTGPARAELSPSVLAAALTFTPQDDGSLAVKIDPDALQKAAGKRLAAFGTPAKDATFRVTGDGISVVPAVDGTGVDPARLAGQLERLLTRPAPRTVTAELGAVHAGFTTEQAKALGITEKVSSFTTYFVNPNSGTNIRVVAAEVDGAIVKPGATFSLNTWTGPRGTAQGYVPAGVIEGGKFTQAVGGGISQFATTMFNAEFFAGVQDIHHQPHSYWISRYPAGREATVFDGLIDLVWRNDSPTGIYVQTRWTPGSITVTFWGTKHYDIESESGPRRNVVTPAVQKMPDDGSCTPQGGQEGFDITVTRVFKDPGSGAVQRREDFSTHYKAEPVIRCVAPEPANPTSASPAAKSPAGRSPGGSTPSGTAPSGNVPSGSARRPRRRRP